jgi:AcrR family transcriptional regulator
VNRRSATASRQKILSSALKVFCGKGYKQTTIREVAHRAGISVGAVYLHFRNKESLYLELMAGQTRLFEKLITPLLKEDPPVALKSYVLRNLDFAVKKKQLVSHHLKELDLDFMKPVRKAFFDGQVQLVEHILRSGVDRGVFKVRDTGAMALLVLFAIRGAAMSHVASNTIYFDRMADHLCAIVTGDQEVV